MTQACIGWDIGGAHLKAVLLDAHGFVLAARQIYCPLWRGLHELERAIDDVLPDFNAGRHAVTMTGELADVFSNRREGVAGIAGVLADKLGGQVQYYAGRHGFVDAGAAGAHAMDIASMNWLASVEYVAQHCRQALFVDIGSTTTDIAAIMDARLLVAGFTDADRMQHDELVYTGVLRTPLMALAQKIPFAGHMTNVAAEQFSTTADVYTLTGDLTLEDNMTETADGAEKGMEGSASRLARMIGHDAQDAPMLAWQQLACSFKDAQLAQIRQAVLRQLSMLNGRRDICLVGAGAGSFLVAELARQLGYEYRAATQFITAASDEARKMAAVCFPAYAVGYLAIGRAGAAE